MKSGCLYLILVLISAWADDLKAGTFVTASPTGTPAFGQEIYPIGRRMIADVRACLEGQIVDRAYLEMAAVRPAAANHSLLPWAETTPRVFRSGDACYSQMSLQW